MPVSKEPVTLPPNTWVDIYVATGESVGTKLIAQNSGRDHARVSESVTTPTSTVGSNNLLKDQYLVSSTTPIGFFAISRLGTVLQVELA